jgi:glycerophosphoryl diester phosphodiesterase
MAAKKDKIEKKYYIKEVIYYLKHNNKPYKETIAINKGNTFLIAHRGLSGIEKENTLPAFELAGQHSYYGIETDVHKTSDGKYVIIHDDSTLRVTGTELTVEKTDYDTLRSLRLFDTCGKLSDKYIIPSLEEYILTCKKFGKIAVLELKNHFEEAEVLEIAEIIEKLNYLNETIFISFDLPNLLSLRKGYPEQPAQFLTHIFGDDLIDTLVKHKLDLDIYFRVLNKARIDLLHSKGIKVNCWTVNEKKYANKLAAWGIDYITTNILE